MALTKIGTDGVKDDAITSGKIPANAVGSSEIADTAVTLAKLEHGTGSNDGKFLRANNGADPTFETVNTTPEGTAVLSTGESGGTKFLREDGDGSCSWQAVPAGGISDVVSDTSPQLGGDLDANGNNIAIGDGEELRFGDSTDFLIKHDGANTYLSNQTGELVFNGDTIRLRKSNGLEDHLKCFADGAVELYHDGTKQCETSASGLSFPSGKGIVFSATADSAATKVGETLDDYEEGTWTPDLQISGSTSGWSYYYRKGHYVKIGHLVHIGCHFYLSGSPGGSGAVRLHGLPYQCDQSGFAWAAPGARRGGGAFSGELLNVYVLSGHTSFPLVLWPHGSHTSGGYAVTQSSIIGSELPTYTEVDITLCYFTAS